jgi:hypothetical protein
VLPAFDLGQKDDIRLTGGTILPDVVCVISTAHWVFSMSLGISAMRVK